MKTIIITGANNGVGLEACKYFVKQKYNVIGMSKSSNNMAKINRKNFSYHKVDITDTNSMIKTVERIIKENKNIDVLVNNAAIFKSINFKNHDIENIEEMIDINFKGVVIMTRLIVKKMLKQKSGKIINISSVSGIHGIENQSVYSATKHALTGFADSLNRELIPHGIQVTNLCPGGINTSLWNDDNPYNGDVNELLQPSDVVDVLNFVISIKNNVIFKNIIFFPKNEIH